MENVVSKIKTEILFFESIDYMADYTKGFLWDRMIGEIYRRIRLELFFNQNINLESLDEQNHRTEA